MVHFGNQGKVVKNSFYYSLRGQLKKNAYYMIFTISSAVLWISCLWFIIQPIPTVILELFFHPHDSLCHSYNSACDVHNSSCDPNKIFCHPYYYENERSVFLMMSSVFVVEWVKNDSNYNTLSFFFAHRHLGHNGAIGYWLACCLQVEDESVGSYTTPGSVFWIHTSIHNNEVSVDSSRVYRFTIHQRRL